MVCVGEDKGGEVHGLHCDAGRRPADRESCSLQPCEYVWITGEWSEVRPGDSVTACRSAVAGGKQSGECRTVGDSPTCQSAPEY